MTLRDVDAVRTTPTKTTHRTEQGLTQSTERTDSTGTYSTNYVAGVELTVANRAGNTASDHDATSHLHLVSTYPQGATADDEDLEDRKLFSWLFLGNQALERTQDVKTVEKGSYRGTFGGTTTVAGVNETETSWAEWDRWVRA